MPDETKPTSNDAETPAPKAKADAADKKPAAKAAGAAADAKADKPPKKEKPPALEDKPFQEFIAQHYLPGLTNMMKKLDVNDLELTFDKQPLPIRGMETAGDCWQVRGRFQKGQRQFLIGFLKEDIQGQKVFCCADHGASFSLLESFMIDERKVSLDLLLLYTVQRLNGQKWLVLN